MNFYNLVQEVLKEGDTLDVFYKKWLELGEKARCGFSGSPQSREAISEFIERNTEFIKSTKDLYQSLNCSVRISGNLKEDTA